MSSTGFEGPVRLELRPSRALAGFLVATHAGAGACLWLAAVPGWLRLVGGLALAASFVYSLRRYARLTDRGAVVRLAAGADATWQVGLADGREVPTERLAEALIHPWLVVVHLRPTAGGRALTVPIAADMLDPDSHRRLRVRLTLARPPRTPDRDRGPWPGSRRRPRPAGGGGPPVRRPGSASRRH